MPDNEDYADLERLLATPEAWTADELDSARMILRQQKLAVAAAHPRDRPLQASMKRVVERLERAIAEAEAQP